MEKQKIKLRNKKSAQLYYHLMILPALIMVFLFNTRTWPGILIAFQRYIPTKGVWGSPWVGLKNFKIFFMQPDSLQIIRNTVIIAVGKLLLVELSAIIFALMLNEVQNLKLKKWIQTAVYLPHFVSWVIFATILKSIIGTNGLINNILTSNGLNKIMFLGIPEIFPGMMIFTQIIKEFGFAAIIYLSAITAIDPGLYEVAQLDGANRWKQTWHITLPGIRYVIVLSIILSLGSILSAGFDQIFNMYNPLVMSTGDIIDTWVYRQGLVELNFGVGAAVGLFKSAIGLILTILAYWAADKFAGYKIF